MINWLWNRLQSLDNYIGDYQNNKTELTWTEAKRWYLVTKPIMNLQELLNKNRCEWLEFREDET